MNLLEQQALNRRRTWLVMIVFVAFLVFLGLGFDFIYVGEAGGGVPIGTIAALGFGSISSVISYFAGDKAVLASSKAVPVDTLLEERPEPDRLKLRQLQNVVEEMAIASGLPAPPVYVVPDVDPNAFATGRGPGHSSIAVTQGLLDTLDREELQGVVAHEMSHIRNYDVRLMTFVAALVGAIALLSDWSGRMMRFGGAPARSSSKSRDKGGGGLLLIVVFVIWIIAIVLAPILARLLAMMLSRQREYLADASGAELTRNPLGLARALEKIEGAVAPTALIKQGSAHLCITDPLGRQVNVADGFPGNLFASHPPMAARIAALRAMAFERGTS